MLWCVYSRISTKLSSSVMWAILVFLFIHIHSHHVSALIVLISPCCQKSRAFECVCVCFCKSSLSLTHSQTEVCVPIGVQVIHPACPYLWCNSTLIHSVANALPLTELHDHVRTATTFSVSNVNTHKHFACGLKCQWSGKCWMEPMLEADSCLRSQTHSKTHTQAQQAQPQCC